MKLLTPSEIQDTRAQQLARDAMRAKDLNKAADDARKNLANAQADFQQALAGQQARWAKEEEDHTKEVAKRQAELKDLEKQREKALEPVKELEQQAKDTLQNAQIALLRAVERESEAQTLSELLQDKLDAIGERETDANTKEQKLLAQEQNLKHQKKIADDNSSFVARSLVALKAEQDRLNKDIADQRTQLILRERSLDARKDALDAKEQELKDWSIRLKDERDTLERAFQRIRTKKSTKKE